MHTTETYKDFMQYLVCSTENEECMIHRCLNCPSINAITEHYKEILGDYEDDQEITFRQVLIDHPLIKLLFKLVTLLRSLLTLCKN